MPWVLIVIFASSGGYNDTRINSGFSQQFTSQASCEVAKTLVIQTRKLTTYTAHPNKGETK